MFCATGLVRTLDTDYFVLVALKPRMGKNQPSAFSFTSLIFHDAQLEADVCNACRNEVDKANRDLSLAHRMTMTFTVPSTTDRRDRLFVADEVRYAFPLFTERAQRLNEKVRIGKG